MNAGGNFDETLTIDAQGKIVAAKGPLTLSDPDPDLSVELYAWVFQTCDDRSGAAYISELSTADFEKSRAGLAQGVEPTRWDLTGLDREDHGKFRPGPATGLALTIAKKPNGETFVRWWADMITLKEEANVATST